MSDKESTMVRMWIKTYRNIKILAEMRRRSIVQTMDDLVNEALGIAEKKARYVIVKEE